LPGNNPRTLALLRQPYVRTLLVISALGTVAGMYVEFRFYAVTYQSGAANAGFFADYQIALSLAALVLQLAVAPAVQSRAGVGAALMVLPAGVLGGAGMVAALSTMITVTLLRVVETGLKSSIHRSSWEQAFLSFEREHRGAAKVLVDGAIARGAGIAAALILILVAAEDPAVIAARTEWLTYAIAVVSLLWLWTTVQLKRQGCGPSAAQEADLMIRLPDS
jgi:ATP/ADP translocase